MIEENLFKLARDKKHLKPLKVSEMRTKNQEKVHDIKRQLSFFTFSLCNEKIILEFLLYLDFVNRAGGSGGSDWC